MPLFGACEWCSWQAVAYLSHLLWLITGKLNCIKAPCCKCKMEADCHWPFLGFNIKLWIKQPLYEEYEGKRDGNATIFSVSWQAEKSWESVLFCSMLCFYQFFVTLGSVVTLLAVLSFASSAERTTSFVTNLSEDLNLFLPMDSVYFSKQHLRHDDLLFIPRGEVLS